MQMEEKKLPWWRRALSIALDGLRSGFGLFSRSSKEDTDHAPETASGQQENPEEESELNQHSPKVETVVETVHTSQSVSPVEVAAEEVRPEPEAAEVLDTPMEAVDAVPDSVPQEEPSDLVPAVDVTEVSDEVVAPEAEAQEKAAPEAAIVSEPELDAPVLEPETEPVEPEPVTQAIVQEIVVEEAPSEVEQEEPAEESPAPSEVVEEVAASVEILDESEAEPVFADQAEIADAAPAIVDSLAPTEASPAEVAEEIPQKVEAAEELPVEPAIQVEVGAGEKTAADAVPDAVESSEPDIEFETANQEPEIALGDPEVATDEFEMASADTAPEEIEIATEIEAGIEVVAEAEEPAIVEESGGSDDPVPELGVSPVELKELAVEEAAVETAVQPDEDEVESLHKTAPVTNGFPEAEQAVEETPEPANATPDSNESDETAEVSELMESNEPMNEPAEELVDETVDEPISERTAEPAALSEAAPGSEEAVVEAVAVVEAGTSAAVQHEPVPETPVAIAASAAEPATPQKPFIKLESRDNEADLSPFSVIVSQVYDGPLDLLLDLIRKQDIDIYDIPIARITAQFLAYVNQLKATDVDVAGEFIYTASLLIHIKSKMLLPRAPSGPDDAAEDPRRELVERLLEHERFKNAAQMLQQKQMLEAATWTNPGLREFKDDEGAEPEIAADTVDLVRIFRDILERARNRPVINVEDDSVTVGQMIQFLSRRLTMEDKPIALRRLLSHTQSERALIAMFLALLELVRLQAILLRQDRAFSEIFIKKHTDFENVMNESVANARDDWR
jgi:segregation and condensation protein A